MTVLFLLLLITSTYGSKILIWNPTLGHSHVRFLGNIADTLTKEGHNVTIFSPHIDPHVIPFGNKQPATTIQFHSPYNSDDDWMKMEIRGASLWELPPVDGMCLSFEDWDLYSKVILGLCRGILDDKNLLQQLRESKFDIALHETYDLCSVGIFEVLGITKTIALSALGMTPYLNEVVGLPPFPSFVPGSFTTYTDGMTFTDRLINFKLEMEMNYRYWVEEKKLWQRFNEHYPGFPNLRELLKNKTGVVMINVNEFTETPRPTTNMIQYIGGATLHEPGKIDEKLDAILNERNRTVLFSLGSLAQSKDMPLKIKLDIIEAFASFPDTTFIWKYEDENETALFSNYANIHLMKWVPQTDLLADSRLNFFITHAGMNSVLESTFYGKPMVTIPLFADQAINAKNAQRRGLAVVVERHKLNKNTLMQAIKEIAENKKFSQKASLVASLLANRTVHYRNEIARWIELIINHGQMEHLPLQTRNMNLFQIFSLDVIGYLLAQITLVVYLGYRALIFIYSKLNSVKFKLQ